MKYGSMILAVLSMVVLLTAFVISRAVGENISPDPNGVKLVNALMGALAIEDPEARLAAVIPLVHKSMLTKDGKDLARSVKDFSYKKAFQNVKFYAMPAVITRVQKGSDLTIGFEETAERGRIDRYFVAKKKGVAGMPAPLQVFWPENGGEPKITNMGSL